VPGRSGAAGSHHGHEAVAQALAHETSEDTIVSIVEVTEVIAADKRAVVIVRSAGTVGGEPFDYETVFHLRTSNGVVAAITEYSGDQYRADRVARRESLAVSSRASDRSGAAPMSMKKAMVDSTGRRDRAQRARRPIR